ncbi:MAG: S-methyl-5-thioribose-1-phosphate isomerase [Planctomycetota bacterium]
MSKQTLPATLAFEDDQLVLIDQTQLPGKLVMMRCQTVAEVHDAIRRLVVRGAPAIGVAAAYGVCLAAERNVSAERAHASVLEAIDFLATSRPTAVNLFWALDRMKVVAESVGPVDSLRDALIKEASTIHEEDRKMCAQIGAHGAELLSDCRRVITHCNAGGLATSVLGTALAPIYHLHASGHRIEVFADETRPLMQGARLTAWELAQAGVPVTVMTDSMAGSLMQTDVIDAVIVGADRIAANGDVANKIGTFPLAVLAAHHDIPFYVAAPSSTFDLNLERGDQIPIEQRAREEVAGDGGSETVPEGVSVINPAFDVTPANLIAAIVTERGVIKSPNRERLESMLR